MRVIAVVVIVTLVALGVAHFVRNHMRRTREELEHVDRSKLRDLSDDDWDDDDWGDGGQRKP